MRILIGLLLVLGLFFLIPGISAWVSAPNNDGIIGSFVGLSFGISFTIIGGSILLLDLIILQSIWLGNGKKETLEDNLSTINKRWFC